MARTSSSHRRTRVMRRWITSAGSASGSGFGMPRWGFTPFSAQAQNSPPGLRDDLCANRGQRSQEAPEPIRIDHRSRRGLTTNRGHPPPLGRIEQILQVRSRLGVAVVVHAACRLPPGRFRPPSDLEYLTYVTYSSSEANLLVQVDSPECPGWLPAREKDAAKPVPLPFPAAPAAGGHRAPPWRQSGTRSR